MNHNNNNHNHHNSTTTLPSGTNKRECADIAQSLYERQEQDLYHDLTIQVIQAATQQKQKRKQQHLNDNKNKNENNDDFFLSDWKRIRTCTDSFLERSTTACPPFHYSNHNSNSNTNNSSSSSSMSCGRTNKWIENDGTSIKLVNVPNDEQPPLDCSTTSTDPLSLSTNNDNEQNQNDSLETIFQQYYYKNNKRNNNNNNSNRITNKKDLSSVTTTTSTGSKSSTQDHNNDSGEDHNSSNHHLLLTTSSVLLLGNAKNQIQEIRNVYLYGLQQVSQLQDLQKAPDAILPGNILL